MGLTALFTRSICPAYAMHDIMRFCIGKDGEQQLERSLKDQIENSITCFSK